MEEKDTNIGQVIVNLYPGPGQTNEPPQLTYGAGYPYPHHHHQQQQQPGHGGGGYPYYFPSEAEAWLQATTASSRSEKRWAGGV